MLILRSSRCNRSLIQCFFSSQGFEALCFGKPLTLFIDYAEVGSYLFGLGKGFEDVAS